MNKDRQEVCRWEYEDPYYGVWGSSCGGEFLFNDGGPVENNVSYCPYCGKRIDADAVT